MSKPSIKENEFFGAPGGNMGTINYQTGYGTFSSPEVSQDPSQFANSNNNKALGSNSNTLKNVPDSGSMERDLGAIYAKKDTPTPDEVICGIKYEMGQQNKKDKQKAKELVLSNLRKDPHFYGGMKMMGVDDESMVKNMQESKQHPNDRPAQLKLTPNVDETKKIFAEMAKAKDKKYVVNSHLVNVIDQMWKEKQQRRSWLG